MSRAIDANLDCEFVENAPGFVASNIGGAGVLLAPLYDPPANHRRTYSTVVPPVRARANQSSSIFIPLQRENIHTHEEAKGAHYIYHTYVRVYTSYLDSEEHYHQRS